ncbi:MAG: hypothetical protein AB7P03_30125 [Kofleriaceae bacterium]
MSSSVLNVTTSIVIAATLLWMTRSGGWAMMGHVHHKNEYAS